MERYLPRAILALLLLCLVLPSLSSEELIDVVYLKNGSVIKGVILEQIPDKSLKIQTKDGSVFVFKMAEVEKIVKESQANSGQASAAGTSSQALPEPSIVIVANPLGFAQFGPFVKGEIRVAPSLYLTPFLRFHALGVVSPLVESSEGETVSIDLSSLGIGFGAMRFLPAASGDRGMYLGAMAEYGWVDSLHAAGESWEWRVSSRHLAILANVGYRWRFASMSILLGGLAGAALPMGGEWWYTTGYLGDSTVHQTSPTTLPFAMLELSVGFEM